ncbi:MAG: GNAT family N-acetyltransferase [Gammaproteobacteria bacterium]|nr:GNAT family N-acetyltransferase [Gammaproteobacteria bacterium]
MIIRAVDENDRDEWARMRSHLCSSPDLQEIDDWYEAANAGGTTMVGVAVLVADRGDGSLAGFVEIGSRPYAEGCATSPVAYLEGWYVDPDDRRDGLGAKLIEAAEAWALSHDYREIASDTVLENKTSLAAHLALGYEEVERQVCLKKRLQ